MKKRDNCGYDTSVFDALHFQANTAKLDRVVGIWRATQVSRDQTSERGDPVGLPI